MWSEQRLWKLIEERCRPDADTVRIDERIWDLFGETWAVMFTDLSGFSRQVARFGIIHFLQVLFEHRKLLLPIVEDHDGILVKAEADSLLLLFRRTSSAVAAAERMQSACNHVNARRVPEEQILLCIGIGYGPILRVGESDVWGAEVNAASKLGEDAAGAGETLITDGARLGLEAEGVEQALEPLDIQVPGTLQAFRVR